MHCGACHSPNTEVETNLIFCLDCGAKTDMHGNAMPRDPQFSAPATGGAGAGT
jgi:hypothetical protein